MAIQKKTGPIELKNMQRGVFTAYLMGDSPLICHAWSKKAIIEMLAKQMGQKLPRYPKSPVQDFLDSIYRTNDGAYGFPAGAIKRNMVETCTSMAKEITKIAATQAFYIHGEQGSSLSAFAGMRSPMQLLRIYSPNPPAMREDMVRLNGRTPDIRYRSEYSPWALIVKIIYNEQVVTRDTVAALIDTGGFAVGLGEWRMAKMGINGAFRLADKNEQKMIDAWAQLPHQEPVLPDEKAFLAGLMEDVRRYGEQTDDEPSTEESSEVPASILVRANKEFEKRTNGKGASRRKPS